MEEAVDVPSSSHEKPRIVSPPSREFLARARFEELTTGAGQITLDTDETSLQWRILQNLYSDHCGGGTGVTDLERAFTSAQRVIHLEFRKSASGGGATEKKLKKLRGEYEEFDQFICCQVATCGHLEYPFHLDDFIQIVKREESTGKLPRLIEYLSALQSSSTRRGGRLKYNVIATSLALFWTAPDLPLWLFPTKNMVGWLNQCVTAGVPKNILTQATAEGVDAIIRDHNLFRLPKELARKFASVNAPASIQVLYGEVIQTTRRDREDTFGGQRKGG